MMWCIIVVSLLAADQFLKHLARENKLSGTLRHIQLTHLENEGLMLGKCARSPLSTAAPCLGFLALLCSLPTRKNVPEKWGVALLLSGGLSNLWDRLRRGSVTDYIRFPHLPGKKLRTLVWNVADFLLLLGGALMLIGGLRRQRR